MGMLGDQINDKLSRGGKIRLTLADFNLFLSREGLEEGLDLKGGISKIFQLVYAQQARLQEHVCPRSQGSPGHPQADALDSLLALVAMDTQRVNDCFELTESSPLRKRARKADENEQPQLVCELASETLVMARPQAVSNMPTPPAENRCGPARPESFVHNANRKLDTNWLRKHACDLLHLKSANGELRKTLSQLSD